MADSGLQAKYFSSIDEPERADLLDESNWLKGWDWKMIEEISGFFDVYDFPPGYVLGEEGVTDPWLGVICSGSVRVCKVDGGSRKEICTLGAGKAIGEISLVDGRPRSATLEVESSLRILVLRKSKFEKLVEMAPATAIKLVLKISMLLSIRLRATSGKLVEFLADSNELLED